MEVVEKNIATKSYDDLYMTKTNQKHDLNMPNACTKYTGSMLDTCSKHLPDACPNHGGKMNEIS